MHHAFVDQLGHIARHRPDLRLHLLGSRRRLIHREPPIRVGEPRAQRFEHPRLHFDRRLGDLDAAYGSARVEADRELERTVLAIDAHEHQCAGHLVLPFADVERDHSIRRLPAHRVVDAAGVGAADMHLARGKLIRAGEQVTHRVLPFHEDDGGRDMQQRGGDRAQHDRLHDFLHHI